MSEEPRPGPSSSNRSSPIPAPPRRMSEDDDPTFHADDYSDSSDGHGIRLGPITMTVANLDIRQVNREGHLLIPGLELAAGPSTGIRSEEEIWDPRATDFFSCQNLLSSDIAHDPGAFVLGQKEKNKAWSEVPCPYYKGEGLYCWKGPSCRMLHMTKDSTKPGQERVTTAYTLDEKPIFNLGMSLEVSVVYVVSPSEFYVIPVDAPTCICEAGFLPKDRNDPEPDDNLHKGRGEMDKLRIDAMLEEYGTGMKAFETMQAKLKSILEENWYWRDLQTPYYNKTQLVAVKIKRLKVRIWYRGIIIDTNVTGEVQREIPFHTVTLIDVGETLTVRADDLCPLPFSLSYYPAMAFKCCLNGVVPVGMRWASRTNTTFESLTAEENLIMTVAKSPELGGVCKTVETRPYLVDLLSRTLNVPENLRLPYNRPSVSIADILSENGLAIKLNNFPYRPELSRFACHSDLLFLAINQKDLSRTTKNEESVRLFHVLAEHIKSQANNDNSSKTHNRSNSF